MESPLDRLKRLVLSWDFWELDRRIVQQDLGIQDNIRKLPSSFTDIQVLWRTLSAVATGIEVIGTYHRGYTLLAVSP